MVKHKRWSDKQKSEPTESEEKEIISEQKITHSKIQTKPKSLILSGTKYVYLIAITALLSGIFTPLTVGEDIEQVVSGMLVIFLGLAGGILIFLGIKNQKRISFMILIGLGLMCASLILIYELLDKSILG